MTVDDELALIPSISGGVDVHIRVTEDPISPQELTSAVIRPGAGAIVDLARPGKAAS